MQELNLTEDEKDTLLNLILAEFETIKHLNYNISKLTNNYKTELRKIYNKIVNSMPDENEK